MRGRCWCNRRVFAPHAECSTHRTQIRTVSLAPHLYDVIEREALRRGTTRGVVMGEALERAIADGVTMGVLTDGPGLMGEGIAW